MNSMTVGKKLYLTSAALVLMTIVLGTVSIVNIARMNESAGTLTDRSLPALGNLAIMVETAYKSTYFAMLSIGADNLPDKLKDENIVTVELKRFDDAAQAYGKYDSSPKSQEILSRILVAHAQMYDGWQKVIPLSHQLKNSEAYATWVSELAAHVEERAAGIEELIAYNNSGASALGASAVAIGRGSRIWTLIILLASVVSGAAAAFFIVRGINRVLSHAVLALDEGASQITDAARQVASSSQSLAQGTSQQAATIEETSAASHEINSMAQKTTQSSKATTEIVTQSQQNFAKANTALEEMVSSMEAIRSASNKISKIIQVIEGIAFQTNILALNAAVEAARAGDAGMGFAVVADEVRNLAQRSAQAAKDTAALIEDSIRSSEEGGLKVERVAVMLKVVTEESANINALVEEIYQGSIEQSRGIDQISQSVLQMEKVTQTSAASAQESAAAAEQLNAQAQSLGVVVDSLKSLVDSNSQPHYA